MLDFNDLDSRSQELEDQVDEAEFEDIADEELEELLADDLLEDEDDEDLFDEDYDDSMDGDHESGLRDAGLGTDEDYGYYGENEDWG
jgi:hypothetical protein